MSNQFISPNWHPLIIHYPLALLSTGILIEVFSFMWPRGFFRAAGRWMILLGALLSVPALAAGLYAYRIALAGGAAQPRLLPWRQVVEQSHWSGTQWQYMTDHIWLNSIGVALVLLAVTAWIASTDPWRRRLYFPVLLGLIAGMGAFGVAGWYGGESVYRLGTAVELTRAHAGNIDSGQAEQADAHAGVEHSESTHGIRWYLPPLELHIVLAGAMVALACAALGLTLRRLERPAPEPEPAETIGPEENRTVADAAVEPVPLAEVPVAQTTIADPPGDYSGPYPSEPAAVFPGRFWMLTFLAALCTSVAGLWSVVDFFTGERLKQNWEHLLHPGNQYRLLLHAIFGAALLLLALLLAIVARFGRRRRGMTRGFIALIVLFIAVQLWLGIAMYFDGHKGPVFRFNPPPVMQQ